MDIACGANSCALLATEPSKVLCWETSGATHELPDLAGAVSLSVGSGWGSWQVCGIMPDRTAICTPTSWWTIDLPGPPPDGLTDVASVDCNSQHCCALRLPYA